MISVYIICLVISIVICSWFFYADVRRSIIQNIMLLIVVAANVGYLAMALSTNTTEALLACRLSYLAGCYIPVLYLLTVCEVCNLHVSKRVVAGLMALQTVMLGIVWSIGYSTVYYSSANYISLNGIGVLEHQYGPLHIIHPIQLMVYFASAIFTAVYTCIKKKNVNKNELIKMIALSGVSVAAYPVQKLVGSDFEIMPVFYTFLMLSTMIPIYMSGVYSVAENQDVIREQLKDVGFIAFSREARYMGANEYALNLFPELHLMNLSRRVLSPSPALKTVTGNISGFLKGHHSADGHLHGDAPNLIIGEHTYETTLHSLENFRGRCIGAMIVLRDITEHVRMLELTEKYNEELNLEVERKTEHIRSIRENTILGIAQMVESRDLSTGGHIKRTSEVVRLFARRLLEADMGFDKRFLDLVIRSAPMHDLGKIGVDDVVLRKQGKFTDEEYKKMKKHAEIGGRMVKDILGGVEEEAFVQIAFNVANYHHEKVNGRGYPCGLKDNEIPVEARIMALADVFDALVSKRCYKDAFSYDKAFGIITNDAGEHFDAALTPVFLACRPELEAYYDAEAAHGM